MRTTCSVYASCCQAIGAKSIDLEWVQVHPTGLVKPDDADAKIKFLAAEAIAKELHFQIGNFKMNRKLYCLEERRNKENTNLLKIIQDVRYIDISYTHTNL